MFKYTRAETGWARDTKLAEKYAGVSPHTIFDDDFTVTVFPSADKDTYPASLLESFLEQFIWLYAEKNKNVPANLALFANWLRAKDTVNTVNYLGKLMNEKYSEYKKDFNKYLVLL